MKTKKKKQNKKCTSEKIAEIVRVNHAGEYGAKRIYQGQLAILKGHKEIQHMMEQEQEHLDYFEEEIKKRNVKPTIFSPIWHMAGFALGAATAVLGEKAAMACTVAVEEVIGDHYQEQLDALEGDEAEKVLRNKISKFRDDELEHRDTGLEHDAENVVGYPILSFAIKTASRIAIEISKRV